MTNSILEGVNTVIDSHFFTSDKFTKFRHEQARSCNALSKAPPNSFDGSALIAAIYDRIEENLLQRPDRRPSSDNWKLRSTCSQDKVKTDSANKSDEVTLERAIVQRWPENWTYQMPVASGLFGSRTDKRRAVDLVYGNGNGCFDMVELKIEDKSGTPLYAAMEILGYGLVYLASRKDSARTLRYGNEALPILTANTISLIVLAPSKYYEKCKLEWLERGLNDNLNNFVKTIGVSDLRMEFRFEKFPKDFAWNHKMQPATLTEKLVRDRVYP